jgi:hypothetical protein
VTAGLQYMWTHYIVNAWELPRKFPESSYTHTVTMYYTAIPHTGRIESSLVISECKRNPNREPYNQIMQMIHVTLANTVDMNPDKSLRVRAGVKFKHPEAYSRGSDLEEFEGFIANILRWLKMNYLLGPTSMELQVSYMGTCLAGKA